MGSATRPAEAKIEMTRDTNATLESDWKGPGIAEIIPFDHIARAHELVEDPAKKGTCDRGDDDHRIRKLMREIAEFILALAVLLTAVDARITGAAAQIGELPVVACEFLPTWNSGGEPLLNYWHLPRCPVNDDQNTAAGTGRVRLIARWTTTHWQLSALPVHASTC
jgi:hypothetical protein